MNAHYLLPKGTDENDKNTLDNTFVSINIHKARKSIIVQTIGMPQNEIHPNQIKPSKPSLEMDPYQESNSKGILTYYYIS